MNLILATILAVAVNDGLTTNYAQELRAEIALADHLVVRLSPENGGATRSVKDLAVLREIAQQLPRSVATLPSEGSISSTDYASVEVYNNPDQERPTYQITVTPSHCAFRVKGAVYELKLPNRSLYDAVIKAAKEQK